MKPSRRHLDARLVREVTADLVDPTMADVVRRVVQHLDRAWKGAVHRPVCDMGTVRRYAATAAPAGPRLVREICRRWPLLASKLALNDAMDEDAGELLALWAAEHVAVQAGERSRGALAAGEVLRTLGAGRRPLPRAAASRLAERLAQELEAKPRKHTGLWDLVARNILREEQRIEPDTFERLGRAVVAAGSGDHILRELAAAKDVSADVALLLIEAMAPGYGRARAYSRCPVLHDSEPAWRLATMEIEDESWRLILRDVPRRGREAMAALAAKWPASALHALERATDEDVARWGVTARDVAPLLTTAEREIRTRAMRTLPRLPGGARQRAGGARGA